MVYEGEQEGPYKVANILIGKAIKTIFEKYFPTPDQLKKTRAESPYQKITNWFGKGNKIDILNSASNKEYEKLLSEVPGLQDVITKFIKEKNKNNFLFMEFLLHGLSEFSLLSKYRLERGLQFKDMLSSMFTLSPPDEDSDEEDDDIYR